MARPRHIDQGLVAKARQVVSTTQDIEQYRQALAVLLPAELGPSLEKTASVLGVGRATVNRLQRRFGQRIKGGGEARRCWGGRRRALMSLEEEKEFLAPWVEKAKRGEVVVVSPLRAALAQQLGRPVAASVVYRFLARHGWRKVAPDTRHPKSDRRVQEDWKKTSGSVGVLIEA